MPHAAEGSKVLSRYVEEVYIIILGIGFILFVTEGDFAKPLFDTGSFNWPPLLYFFSLYFFLTYDWIAYNSLIERYPYPVSHSRVSLGRFFCDIFALLIKSFLIFLSTREVTYIHVLSASFLFVLWHSTIMVWYAFAKSDQVKPPPIWRTHLLMVVVYAIFGLALRFLSNRFPIFIANKVNIFLVVLCMIIILHAFIRMRYLLKRLTDIR